LRSSREKGRRRGGGGRWLRRQARGRKRGGRPLLGGRGRGNSGSREPGRGLAGCTPLLLKNPRPHERRNCVMLRKHSLKTSFSHMLWEGCVI
jgi:hypothetical protein